MSCIEINSGVLSLKLKIIKKFFIESNHQNIPPSSLNNYGSLVITFNIKFYICYIIDRVHYTEMGNL